MKLKKIISGGQSGADFAGLLVGIKLGFETGGWIPRGFKSEIIDKKLLESFGLKETEETDYVARTMLNVDDSDGTIAFRTMKSIGTDKTIGYCESHTWKYPTEFIQKAFRCSDVFEIKKNLIFPGGNDAYKPCLVITHLRNESITKDIINRFINDYQIEILNIAGHRESSSPGMCDGVEKILTTALKISLDNQL